MTTQSQTFAAPLSNNAVSTTLRAIAIGGLAVGVLDATDGVAFAGITAHQNPIQVLQWIATGILGTRAFEGGLTSAGLGALVHFALAYGFTAAFVLAYERLRLLREHWVVGGLAWGVGVWAFMNLVVLPHSPVPVPPLTTAALVNGVVGHALTVGLAAAYVARRILGGLR